MAAQGKNTGLQVGLIIAVVVALIASVAAFLLYRTDQQNEARYAAGQREKDSVQTAAESARQDLSLVKQALGVQAADVGTPLRRRRRHGAGHGELQVDGPHRRGRGGLAALRGGDPQGAARRRPHEGGRAGPPNRPAAARDQRAGVPLQRAGHAVLRRRHPGEPGPGGRAVPGGRAGQQRGPGPPRGRGRAQRPPGREGGDRGPEEQPDPRAGGRGRGPRPHQPAARRDPGGQRHPPVRLRGRQGRQRRAPHRDDLRRPRRGRRAAAGRDVQRLRQGQGRPDRRRPGGPEGVDRDHQRRPHQLRGPRAGERLPQPDLPPATRSSRRSGAAAGPGSTRSSG